MIFISKNRFHFGSKLHIMTKVYYRGAVSLPLRFVFSGGVHPKGNKNTDDFQTTRLDSFSSVEILLQQHVGPPCVCVVKKGDHVHVGQLIGRADHPMAVPIHASVSGEVTDVRFVISATGDPVEAVTITSDGLYTVDPSCVPPVINSREDFLHMIRTSGLVGLGGASFPVHIKLNPPKGKEPDVLLVNAAECEPYITSDFRQICERPDEIIDGILAVLQWLSIPNAIIGIEDNKPLGQEVLHHEISKREVASNTHLPISLKSLKTLYPQGAEKMLIYSLTGRKVPPGKLPYDVRVLVMNVGTLRFIGEYLKNGIPLVRKSLTLDGSALNTPGNVNVPIGARIPDVIAAAGGTKEEPSKIIMGGAMMGVSLDRIECGIIKANNAILVFGSKEARIPAESPCIHCGRCVTACPMHLMPTGIDQSARRLDTEGLAAFHVLDCIECGCCTYSCPAKRYLTQSIRNGKTLLRIERARAAEAEKIRASESNQAAGKEDRAV